MKILLRHVIIVFLALPFLRAALFAEVTLPSIVGDGMVLQRDTELKIWGWADPEEPVTVRFREQQKRVAADSEGKWQVVLDPIEAGGPYDMDITGGNRIELTDIYIGDVWICSGQSNMTHDFSRHSERYAAEIAASENPEIRQFYVPTNATLDGPLDDIGEQAWKGATPESLHEFTVVGYFFAKKLADRYGVAQGIINTCVGGTKVESWTSAEGFKAFPDLLETIRKNMDSDYVDRVNAEAKADREVDGPKTTFDKGLAGAVKWFDPAYEPLNWKRINVPGYWEDQGLRDLDGVVWYRREIDVPDAMVGVEVAAKLGRIRNADEFYVNGEKVGGWTYEYPQRNYVIPAGILKPGKNLLVVRVTNQSGKGGFIHDRPYHLAAAGRVIDLKGDWEFKVGEVFRKGRQYKKGIRAQDQPASLYNGMIAPFVDYAVRGFLWYQGESNWSDPERYGKLLPNLIEDWREKWGQEEAVFLIAQLPNYMDIDFHPSDSHWARLREAQLQTALNTPHTGIGINIELGEWNDIHPGNKKPVGERLALQAMRLSYGDEEIVASGPIYESHRIDGGKVEIRFDSVGSGLVANNGEALSHFAIAGDDMEFVWATAMIEGDAVIVWNDEVPNPKYVRYAWANNPDFANLYNKEGLPASPFRTDK